MSGLLLRDGDEIFTFRGFCNSICLYIYVLLREKYVLTMELVFTQ